ncbi:MAG: RHS repeat-associated core domain-containing protein [Thermoanaerobaculia bacterium]|nr:RHS repeat-associated core domain-containing protein [Thermoanaerobaculia bacterium]
MRPGPASFDGSVGGTAARSCETADRRLGGVALLLVAVLAMGAREASGQTHPNLDRGFAPERAYQIGEIDQVSLYNGNLSITLPIGQAYPLDGGLSYQLVLSYNSKLWDFQRYPSTGRPVGRKLPSRAANAGLGWVFGMGQLFGPDQDPNTPDTWTYVSPDGAEHELEASTLHPGISADGGATYSRDGSYLRLRRDESGQLAEVDHPDGTIHRFEKDGQLWKLTRIQSRYTQGAWVSIAYPNPWTWLVTDSAGRAHEVRLEDAVSDGAVRQVVKEVWLSGFGGGWSVWKLTYDSRWITLPCAGADPAWAGPIQVPMLSGLVLPDSDPHDANEENGRYSLTYYLDGYPSPACRTGAVSAITTPMGGTISYSYQFWFLPTSPCDEDGVWTSEATGVAARTLTPGFGQAAGTWTYQPELFSYDTGTITCGGQQVWPPPEEMRLRLTSPTGDQSYHYFSVWTARRASTPDEFSRADHSLPYTRRQTDGDPIRPRFLSVERCAGACTGNTVVRREYLRYEDDGSCFTLDECSRNNRRLASRKTVYEDDGGKWRQEDYSDFDGLGHYRQVVVDGSFPSGEAQTTTINYNPNRGTYPGNFTMPESTDPWVLGTFDGQTTQQGGASETTRFAFDEATGFLLCQRRLAPSGALGATDLLETFEASPSGNLVAERSYGGDGGGLGTSSTCATGAASAAYALTHTYDHGVRSASRYLQANGSPLGFFAYSATIDPSTGLPSQTRDTAGFWVDLSYDNLGRVTEEAPGSGDAAAAAARSLYSYTKATGSSPAKVHVERVCPSGVANCSGNWGKREYSFDGLGRPIKERVLGYDGSWSRRETKYNAVGWKTHVSEFGPDSGTLPNWTTFSQFDAFGRPRTITPPDGAGHEITLVYTGDRLTDRKVKVATDISGGETTQKTTEEVDFLGRLRAVTEPSLTLTRYSYDVGGRLARVCMAPSGSTCGQERLFVYDGRGLLSREQHPELGAAGNDSVHYLDYDARGHAARRRVGGTGSDGLRFAFDRAERLVEVHELSSGAPVKQFVYDTAGGGWGNGKLHKATRWNRYPDLGSSGYVVRLEETYAYGGVEGRVSAKETEFLQEWPPPPEAVAHEHYWQGYTYDLGGQLERLDYPRCTGGGSCMGTPPVLFPEDVPPSHPERANIEAISYAGITVGCGPELYCPDSPLTRGQMARFLIRASSGSNFDPPPCTGAGPFNDVPCSAEFAKWIAEFARRGITSGCGAGNYCPTAENANNQMAVFLLRSSEGSTYQPPPCTNTGFADVPCGANFSAWIQEVARRGIMIGGTDGGCTPGNFCPTAAVTRARMAKYMVRTSAFGIGTNVEANRPYAVRYGYANGYLRTIEDETNAASPVPLASDLRYHRNGMLSEVVHASGVVEQIGADPKGMARPSYHRTTGVIGPYGAAGDWSSGTYAYDGAGNVKAMGLSRFAYDGLSRLTVGRVRAYGSDYTQEVDFDRFGNITRVTSTTFAQRELAAVPSTNRLQFGVYDARGNLTNWNGWSHTFDPQSMLAKRTNGTSTNYFVYTADDERYWTYHPGGASSFALRDLDGRVLRAYSTWGGAGTRYTDYVYRGSRLLARDTPYARAEAMHLDHLGTPRLYTNSRRDKLGEAHYYPFGEEVTVTEQTADRMRFTGHERDTMASAEVGDDLDYLHARFSSPLTGRFLSVDPIPGHPRRPQSWNQYAYVQGNPLNFTDPSGLVLKAMSEQAKADMCTLVGSGCARHLSFADDGTVTVTATKDELAANEALNLFNDMASSEKTYGAYVGTALPALGGSIALGTAAGKRLTFNVSTTPDTRQAQQLLPPIGFAGVAGVFAGIADVATGVDSEPAHRPSALFHELAENYLRTEKMMQWKEAHPGAIERENRLRSQRPEFRHYVLGAGMYLYTQTKQ